MGRIIINTNGVPEYEALLLVLDAVKEGFPSNRPDNERYRLSAAYTSELGRIIVSGHLTKKGTHSFHVGLEGVA